MSGSKDMGRSGKHRVVVFQESLPDYRIPFLNALGEETELTVAYSQATGLKDVRPDPSLVRSFTLLELTRSGPASGLWSWHPELLKHIRKAMPDVVIAEPRLGLFTSWALSFSEVVKPRLIWWMSGHEPTESGWRKTIRRVLRRALYPRAIACIGYGSHTREYLKELGVDRPVFIAPNAADTTGISLWAEKWDKDVSLQDASRALRQGAGFVVLFVGRMVEAKRLPLLMHSLSVLARDHSSLQWRALLVGDGPERENIESLAMELGIADRLSFAGALHGAQNLITWFRAADLFVLPGKGGLALNEAISYGLPVLLTSADGTEADMVEQGVNGYILPGAGPEDIAKAIARLAGDPELREKMCKASLDIAATRSNLTKMTAGFLEAINAVGKTNIQTG
jgi:glycosyltransferase involved in cell wall biosynthesis